MQPATIFMDLDTSAQVPQLDSIPSLGEYNQSIEGDFWSAATSVPQQLSVENSLFQQDLQNDIFENSNMTVNPSSSIPAAVAAITPYLASPHNQQQQQQQPPPSSQPMYPSAMNGPPAHLFATPFSPFQHATFEVENDLNGVNPSNLFLGITGVNAPIPRHEVPNVPTTTMTRGTSESGSSAMTPQIGQIAPQSTVHDMQAFDSYDSPPQQQQQQQKSTSHTSTQSKSSSSTRSSQPSRKRARGPAGVAQSSSYGSPEDDDTIDLEPEDELRNLEDSTFAVQAPVRVSQVSNRTSSSTPAQQRQPLIFPPDMSDSDQKKVKHQMTDRQRRAKIKESMDALKKLVPLEPNQKADQATIVANSVTTISNLKDEVAELRAKLQEMELNQSREANKLDSKRQMLRSASGYQQQPNLLSNSPFTSMMASLNGAGVSMWRIGLTGKIIEVNLVFELVSGFSAAEVVGNTPCGPPLFGSLSIMPSAFLKAFSEVSAIPQANQPGQLTNSSHDDHTSPNSSGSIATTPHFDSPLPNSPGSMTSSSSTRNLSSPSTPQYPQQQQQHQQQQQPVKQEPQITVNPNSTAQTASQASVAPLYANASISNFPVVPQAELENFFPYKCKSLINAHSRNSSDPKAIQPQPHGNFLVAHLAALPYNHVLKLLCRHHTLWGEILESIVTLCLVRDAQGQPDYIMLLSTPDCRRLLTPAAQTRFEPPSHLLPCTDMRVDGTIPGMDEDM